MVKTPAEPLTLRSEEGEALIAQVHQRNWSAVAAAQLAQIVRLYVWLVFALQDAKLSVKRLRTLLFGSKPQSRERPASPAATTSSEVPGQVVGGAPPTPGAEAARRLEVVEGAPGPRASGEEGAPKPTGGHRVGTGRLGAAAYTGAPPVECRHEELAVGQRCPVCGQGTRSQLPAGVEIRIDANALLSALHYEIAKLRCAACGEIFTAELPAGVSTDKYSTQARAVLAVSRYSLGVPGYRVQGYQAMLGVPVPDATPWDQIEAVGDCAYKVFEQREHEPAQGELIFQDDTAVRIVSLIEENHSMLAAAQAQGVSTPKERTGRHTPTLVVQVGAHTAILYYSSRRQAGENLLRLLDKRQAGLATPLAMSDALSSNAVADESIRIRWHCLAHGRRKFSDLEEVFPRACQVVLEVIKQVFDHDEHAREEQLSPQARLAYHQTQSQPLMDERTGWLDTQIDDHLVEPNSALGKAMASMQSHWETLTRFVSLPGAPLDNNRAERVLKRCIRQRKNSLLYKNTHSAYIASVLTSLIATCLYAGVNAVDSLVALQEHRREVFVNPAAWLPWAYASSRASP